MTAGSVTNLIPVTDDRGRVDLDQVFREHAATVSGWVRRLLGHQDASDAVQEIFEVAQRRLQTFRGEASIATWLYSITVRVVSARRRRARVRRLLFFQAQEQFFLEMDPVQTPADELDRAHATRVVYSVLEHLSERDRALLILFELERLSQSEIALILNTTENSVAVGLNRAKKRFRSHLCRQFPEEARGPS